MKKEKLLVIVGPTAVGKSKVAIILAKSINGEIISADSMQVYKDMDIGTAKPSFEDRAQIKHHLIDIVDLKEDFSVAEYQRMAREVIMQIHGKGKLPILVGGSGLYIRAVIDKLEFPWGMMKSPIRHELEKRVESEGLERLYRELQNSDPQAAKKIHPHDARRIIRALEVIKLTGRSFSEYHKEWGKRESIYDVKIIGLNLPRKELHANIDRRVDEMMEKGLFKELKDLVLKGYKEVLTSSQALGYKELFDYLEGKSSLQGTVERIKQRTRQFAKRQLTWFRRDPRIKWMDVSGKSVEEIASEILDILREEEFI